MGIAVVLAVLGITWIVEGSGSDPGRNDDRLDQLEREALKFQPPGASRPKTRRVASCYGASQAPYIASTSTFTGTREEAFAFYQTQLLGLGGR